MKEMNKLMVNSIMSHLYPDNEPYDQRDENYVSSDEDRSCYCEVCDKEFATEQLLVAHKASHRVCGIDGCNFFAHPLLVEKHVKMQHNTGLYHRMKNLSTPEDIEKWIRERKRKYPTKANIELKKAEENEKKERGEVIKENRAVGRTKSSNAPEKKRRARKRRHKSSTEVSFYPSEIYRGISAFPGIASLAQPDEQCTDENLEEKLDESIIISDEEDVPQSRDNSTIIETRIPNLVANYGSDSEQDEGPEEVPIKKVMLEDHSAVNVNQSIINSEAPVKSNANERKTDNPKVPRQRIKDQNVKEKDSPRNIYSRKYNVNRLQLLNKLLSRSIQHERNLICQCLKYIVDNNYFAST